MQKTFNNFGLSKKLILNLKEQGFIIPTEVQSQAIEPFLDGSDIIACAKTGSGKTGAYLIPIIEMLSKEEDSCALVVAPTRELAQQISQVFITLAKDFNIKPALKNVLDGIMFVKSCALNIIKESPNLLHEIQTYSWKTTLNGQITEDPVKYDDHALDALRYALYSHKASQNQSVQISFI